MMKEELDRLIEIVRQEAYRLHIYLGNGLLEKVYENGLKHRLELVGLKIETQKPLKVMDEDGYVLGDYFADMVVEGELIIELKAVKALANEHLAQLLNYLTIAKQPVGLLINFGSYKFETRIAHQRKFSRSFDLDGNSSQPFFISRRERVECRELSPTSPRSPDLHG